ncbi:MAG: hypothetical protein WBA93_36130 [Microcoleaceae cyanobacterium]
MMTEKLGFKPRSSRATLCYDRSWFKLPPNFAVDIPPIIME